MIKSIIYLLTCLLTLLQLFAEAQVKNKVSFDNNWRFHKGRITGGEQPLLNEAGWRMVNLPHDWSIEDLPGTTSPYNFAAKSGIGQGFTTQGTAWYRKTFYVSQAIKSRQVIIQFDGVYMNSDVYINGHHIGNHPYGYTGFYYDIGNYLKFNQKNVIAVEVKNEGLTSRWYAGSGIYRHVWLKIVNAVHIAQWGNYITTTKVTKDAAQIYIKTKLVNQSKNSANLIIISRLLTAAGTEAGRVLLKTNIAAGQQKEIKQYQQIKQPALWAPDSPVLYKAVTDVYSGGKLINREETPFGIRKITFDVNNGFQLNGKTLKLKGGSVHNDNGPLGARAYDRAEERKVEILKANGFNAIRCSHNPPSSAFLDACDRLGMLVIDEAFDMWNKGKSVDDYHIYFKKWWKKDLQSMIERDRNHPSIIMWSIGNEIPEKTTPNGVDTARILANYVKLLDPSRPVTAAVDELKPDKDAYFSQLDVAGYNYAVGNDEYNTGIKGLHDSIDIYKQSHERVPQRVMVGTESFACEAFANWVAVLNHSYVIGDFVWTAFDYMGESSIGWLGYPQGKDSFPWNLAYCGDIDICGWKRPQSYYRDALWNTDQLALFVKSPYPSFKPNPNISPMAKWGWPDVTSSWNWKGYENKPIEVVVYSSCEKTELFLNGSSLGIKPTGRATKFAASWQVPYQQGELKAIGYSNNQQVKIASLQTAQKPIKITLAADRTTVKADGQDLSYITVELKDEKGVTDAEATNLVNFKITGDASIVGVGNANPISTESNQLPHRKAWRGRCLVIIKTGLKPGQIILNASSAGLAGSVITLNARNSPML